MAILTSETIFTRDILGRYVCNTFTEAMNSGPFDVIIIGGGTFGLALAQDLYFRSKRFDRGLGNVPEDVMAPPRGEDTPSYESLRMRADPVTEKTGFPQERNSL